MNSSKIGRYEIVAEIGRGAMGVVYKALDPVLDRTVAIKTIGMSHDPGERAEYEARFYQEAKAAGSLAHPNIVVVHDVGNSDDTAYMAMEYLEGEELGASLGDGRRASLARALEVAIQIAAGLAYAHARGVVHRDIKPANIMVLKDGTVKITDFGIARMRTSEVKTQTGKLLGSPRYMSPEVFLGKRADHRSDIFSLGIILYELVTGVAPFSGENVSALMHQTVNVAPPSASLLRTGVPEMLDFVLAKMLAKDPEQRYQSADEVMSDLRECLRSLPLAASETGGEEDTIPQAVPSALVQQLMETVPLRANEDLEPLESAAPAPTIGISAAFDSMAAAQRLAQGAGIGRKSQEYRTTVKMDRITPRTERGERAAFQTNWSHRELVIFAAGIAIAVAIAIAMIAL